VVLPAENGLRVINFGIHPIWEDRYEIITNTLDKNGMLEWGQNGGIIFLRFDTYMDSSVIAR